MAIKEWVYFVLLLLLFPIFANLFLGSAAAKSKAAAKKTAANSDLDSAFHSDGSDFESEEEENIELEFDKEEE